MEQQFLEEITKGYTFKSDFILLGGAVLDGKIVEGAQVKAPLKMFNRHGLIAGATGTGKTVLALFSILRLLKNS
jgi:DNA helicase HerA-like ATPase